MDGPRPGRAVTVGELARSLQQSCEPAAAITWPDLLSWLTEWSDQPQFVPARDRDMPWRTPPAFDRRGQTSSQDRVLRATAVVDGPRASE